ncbi:MAG: hypothetical protein IPF75_05250 [Bacteroidetes bacterium]|nr:hypothetical protein [Bacteroidota bacterium]
MNQLYFSEQLSFDEEFFNEFKIYRYSNNIFIPKEIADELRKLWVMNTQRQPLENLERFHFVKLKKKLIGI